MFKKIPLTKTGITCMTFNKDRTRCAVCPNSNEILIFDTKGSKEYKTWILTHVLEEVKDIVKYILAYPNSGCT